MTMKKCFDLSSNDIELELKYTFPKSELASFLENYNLVEDEGSRILQLYFTSDIAELTFDKDKAIWVFKINHTCFSKTYSFCVRDEEQLSAIKSALSQEQNNINVLDIAKSSVRMRFYKGKCEFTVKMKPYFEFNYDVVYFEDLESKVSLFPYIDKKRIVFECQGRTAELDIYTYPKNEDPSIEFEFDYSEKEQMDLFKLQGINQFIDSSDDYTKSNKYMALSAYNN